MRKAAHIIVLLGLAAIVGGCSLLEGSRPWPDERRIVARDWVKPQIDEEEPAIYCYRTLATPDCHSKPLPGGEARIVNSHDAGAYGDQKDQK